MSTLGVVGVGQLGLGIAYVAAKVAKVDVLMADRDEKVIKAGFAFIDKLLAKDVKKGKMTEEESVLVRGRISSVSGLEEFGKVDLVVEVCLSQIVTRECHSHDWLRRLYRSRSR